MSFSLSLTLLTSLVSTPVMAQGIDGLDDPVQEKATNTRSDEVVKEIQKGLYAKSNFGAAGYLGTLRGTLRTGSAIGVAFGQDFVDKEDMSMAWEIALLQGVHNGTHFETQGDQGGPYIQGDTRTYSFLANYEYSIYPNRRFGIGVRVGGGLLTAPLLMDEEAYLREVVQGAWGGIDPGYHSGIKPVGFGGVTGEYYTKLSHFSVGVDADVFYAVGFDLGFNATGYFKYTF